MSRVIMLTARAEKPLLKHIRAWQKATTLVHGGGLEPAYFGGGTGAAAPGPSTNPYITAIDSNHFRRIRQDGFVYGAKIGQNATSIEGQVKFKVFRPNGTNYDFIGESELFSVPSAAGVGSTLSFVFTAPIPCAVGDYFGYATPATSTDQPRFQWGAASGCVVRYKYADVSATDAFTSNLTGYNLNVEALVARPYVAITGDSIAAGYREDCGFYDLYTLYDSSYQFHIEHDPGHQLQHLIASLHYQNHGKGSQAWNWVRSIGMVSALATSPKYLIVHCGVNDIQAARTWENVAADMDAVKAACDAAGTTLLVDEILPWTNGTDDQAALIRTWNGNYTTWCAANGVTRVTMHDAFGKVRATTGELDDLADAYDDGDHVHVSLAGKQLQAQFWRWLIK